MPEETKKQHEQVTVDDQVLEEMRRIAEKSSPHSPYFDNIHGHQEFAEIEKVRDWAKEMEKCRHSVSCIRSHCDDPPDVLAELDGKPIGIEVTDLIEYPTQHALCIATAEGDVASLRWKQRRNGTFEYRWHGTDLGVAEKAKWERQVEADPDRYKGQGVEWSLERFQTRLVQIVDTKDEKAGRKKAKRTRMHGEDALDCRLHSSFLLIFTPEFYLQDHLDEYMEKTTVRRPENFDRVFLMGHYVPGERPERHPVFEVRLVR